MTRDASRTRTGLRSLALSAALAAAGWGTAGAQWVQQSDQFYLPAEHNWAFRSEYSAADRLFNAFDYGHAILYEKLYTRPGAPPGELEEKEYDFITRKLLVKPPRVPLEEGAIEIAYAKIAPEAKAMFDWAHVLHRQIYDVWADESIPLAEKDARVAELLRYYKSRPDLAFSSVPKSMELMEGQYFSLAFRREYPKFNGLIWAYHWLQVGLYEPLVTGKTVADRQTGVLAAVARFKQMLENPPADMPRLMPMTVAVAPAFAARYPEAAIIFDNLHAMHDVISDILASPEVLKKQKREEILRAGARYRDSTSFAWTEKEWRQMSHAMGAQNMGGPAVGFLAALPKPTVAIGATHADAMQHGGGGMAGMDHSKMSGMQTDSARGAGRDSKAGMDHGAMGADTAGGQPAPGHAAMGDSAMGKGAPDSNGAGRQASMSPMMEMHRRMMADPVIRQRIMADTAMRRMMQDMERQVPPDQRGKTGTPKSNKKVGHGHPAPAATPSPKQPADTATDTDHGGMDHDGMPGRENKKP